MLSVKAVYLKSHRDRMLGLLGKSRAYPVYIKTRFGIHTIGLKFNIDVLVLDRHSRVVKMKSSLPPNRIFIWPLKYNIVVELPEGFIVKHKIKIGDKVLI